MIYLCSVYSHGEGKEDPAVRQRRYELTRNFIAQNIDKHIYSPIVHHHEMAEMYDLPKDYEFWKKKDRDFIRRCDSVWILDVVNEEDWAWDESEGIKDEATFAMECGIPTHRVVSYAPDKPMPEEVEEALKELQAQQEEENGQPN
jgi:hypothetical protein